MELKFVKTGYYGHLSKVFPFPNLSVRTNGTGYIKREGGRKYLYFKSSINSAPDKMICSAKENELGWIEVTEVENPDKVSFLDIYFSGDENTYFSKTYVWDSDIVDAYLVNDDGKTITRL